MSEESRMASRRIAKVMAGIVALGMVPMLGGIAGCAGGTGPTPVVDGGQAVDDPTSDTTESEVTQNPAGDAGDAVETTYYDEPSLDDLPENRSGDEVEDAVDRYLQDKHPNREVRQKELIGELTTGSSMWASYVVRFTVGKDIGLEVTAMSTASPTVTEERYLRAANGLYYDVETQQYVTDLEVFGGGLVPQEQPDEATTADANPEAESRQVMWVKNDKGEKVRVVVGDLEP